MDQSGPLGADPPRYTRATPPVHKSQSASGSDSRPTLLQTSATNILDNVPILIVRGLNVVVDGLIHRVGMTPDDVIKLGFGHRVRELRTKRQLSQEGLAVVCDLDRTYIGGIERGERNVSLLNIHRIASALGVPVRELFP